jgi:hypothetical protein
MAPTRVGSLEVWPRPGWRELTVSFHRAAQSIKADLGVAAKRQRLIQLINLLVVDEQEASDLDERVARVRDSRV